MFRQLLDGNPPVSQDALFPVHIRNLAGATPRVDGPRIKGDIARLLEKIRYVDRLFPSFP
jgi:hypothetical protein